MKHGRGIYSIGVYRLYYHGNIRWHCTKSSKIFTVHATSTDDQSVGDLPLEIQTE
jgi:hypothetical protein